MPVDADHCNENNVEHGDDDHDDVDHMTIRRMALSCWSDDCIVDQNDNHEFFGSHMFLCW